MTIFNKCKNYEEAKKIQELGFYPYFRVISTEQDTEVICNGKKMLMMGSNSYLGLTNHPRIKEASIQAVKKYGSGCAGSRFLNGTLDIHIELEERLAKLTGKEAALVFATGYQANVGTISTIVSKGDLVITDKLDHASIIEGCKLSYGEMLRFNHNDISSLEKTLQKKQEKNSLVVIDGIFSMEGDIADLPGVVELCKKYQADLMVDDAHSIGVLHDTGAGTAKYFDLTNNVDIIMGTFSKSLASVGGFITASEDIIHYIKHFSRALIFSASLPPSSTAAALEALNIMEEEPERITKLWENTHYMADSFKNMGYDIGKSNTPIIPLYIGDMIKTFKMWKYLDDEGVFINPIIPPAVQPNSCMIRCSFMSTHSKQQLDMALDKFYQAGKVLEII